MHVANIKSQIKRNVQNEKRREHNAAVKTGLRTRVREFRAAVASGDSAEIQKTARAAARALDKAVSDGVIHKNQAANRKSAVMSAAARSNSNKS
jgi:small subunit ribosomal protein S20